jgi:hypothetical protein
MKFMALLSLHDRPGGTIEGTFKEENSCLSKSSGGILTFNSSDEPLQLLSGL